MKTVTLIPGDGIGPEVVEAVKSIFSAAEAPIVWEEENIGKTALEQQGKLIPDSLLQSIQRHKVGLKGPASTPIGEGFKSVNVQLRQRFDLYANIRPCKTIEGIESRYTDVDLVIFRENTEGLYSGLDYYDERLKIADAISRITAAGSHRIIKAAFEFAAREGRKKVTLVHKANILKQAGRILLEAGAQVAAEYPEIVFEDKIIDNMAMQLVRNPERFDVIVTSNLFGDILSDLCAGLVGGLGVVSGANIGDEIAVFEAVHGTAPNIAGKGLANPTAVLRSSIMMLHFLQQSQVANQIEAALMTTLKQKELCTQDLGGKASTEEFTQNIIKHL